MRRPSVIVALILVALFWVVLLVAAPSAASHSHPYAPVTSALVYAAGSLICHQRPDRSFHLGDAQLPVCARCLGLYAGGFLGMFAWAGIAGLRSRPSSLAQRIAASSKLRRVLLLIALPTVLSVVAGWLQWWDLQNVGRALLALPLGAVIGAIVCAVAAGDLR